MNAPPKSPAGGKGSSFRRRPTASHRSAPPPSQLLESAFGVTRRRLFAMEMTVFAELDFRLVLPGSHVYPHFVRLLAEHYGLMPQEYAPHGPRRRGVGEKCLESGGGLGIGGLGGGKRVRHQTRDAAPPKKSLYFPRSVCFLVIISLFSPPRVGELGSRLASAFPAHTLNE